MIPISARNMVSELPPELINGSGNPVGGMLPVTTRTLIMT